MSKRLPTIAMFVEGTFLPSREGATRRFVGVARHLQAVGHKIIVIHCYRRWSDLRQIDAESFITYAVTPDIFYSDLTEILSILRAECVEIAQFSEIETVCSLGIPIRRLLPHVRLSYECHDVHSEFLTSMCASTEEIAKVQELETFALPLCDVIFCFTLEDQARLVNCGADSQRVHVVPFGIEIDDVTPHSYSPQGRKVVFLGNLYHRPNQSAVRFISGMLAPKMRASRQHCEFIVVGDCPPEICSGAQHEDVSFVGSVEHLSDLLSGMTVAVSPITVGSGIKVKLLDYFAAGLPTIGTTISFRGYPQNAGVVVPDLQSFPHALGNLIGDKELLLQMSMAGGSIAKAHDWRNIRGPLSKHFETTANMRRLYRADMTQTDPPVSKPYVLGDNMSQDRFRSTAYPRIERVLKLGGREPR
jgi:glycosyltransferase involved in cell wall biosynthesis